MSRRDDLETWAYAFRDRIVDLLDQTVTTDAAVTVFVYSDQELAIVAPGQNLQGLNDVEMVPLSTHPDPAVRDAASLWLNVWFLVGLDDEGENLAVQKSGFGLCVKPSTGLQPIRIEYDRHKTAKQPAHLQITGESASLGAAYALAGKDMKALHKLHIPLGDRRFRPSLEDFIEFLVQESLIADLHPGWQAALEASRGDWLSRQARAAVRRRPHDAVTQLRKMGYRVEEPIPAAE